MTIKGLANSPSSSHHKQTNLKDHHAHLALTPSLRPSLPTPVGTDTFNDMKKGKWKHGRELLDLVSVVIVSRPGVSYALQEEDVTNPRLHFYNVPSLGEVSSTAVRKTTDLKLLREVVEPRVLEYIRERGLYALGRVEGGD